MSDRFMVEVSAGTALLDPQQAIAAVVTVATKTSARFDQDARAHWQAYLAR
jgi:hypothetical protein